MSIQTCNEIFKLKRMLEEANIPFTFTDDFFHIRERRKKYPQNDEFWEWYIEKHYPAYQIRLNKYIDVIEYYGSHGYEEDLLEIMGGLTKEEEEQHGSVLGWLTAEEAFKRFKYCYEHNTSVYKKEIEE